MAFSAQCDHLVEHIYANMMPIVLPLALFQTHILTLGLFLRIQLIERSSVLSGHDFVAARMHDRHHEKIRSDFGALGLLNRLLGGHVESWIKMHVVRHGG